MSIFISLVMFALALLHIYWGHGGNWPGNDRQSLTDKVFGQGNQFPSILACYNVAAALILAGAVPLFTESILFGARFSNYSWFNFIIALPLMIRGVGGYLPAVEKRWTQVFVRNNRLIYSPLCIGLALSYIFFGLQ
ncbi:DUF3995 domain-containing protein [Bdellovibrio bacteriovorus]|uniref:DUF3995 domain-containing protein n=1 Tax=Bdellovibrio bacteriovorus TaxID=959 RepID=UPI0035A6B5CE